MRTKAAVIAILLAGIGLGWWWWQSGRIVEESPVPYEVTYLDSGLDPDTRKTWHRTPEGSELLPLSFFKSLEDSKTGKPFVSILPRFGFLIDPDNEDGLPVGWSSHQDSMLGIPVMNVGVNCSACHSGQIDYKGKHLRIDGAPNMVDIEGFANDLQASLTATLANPRKAFVFLRRIIRLHHDAKSRGEFLEVDDDTMAFINQLDENETTGDRPDQEVALFLGSALEHAADDPVKELDEAHAEFDLTIGEEGGNTPEIKEHVGEILGSLKVFRDYLQARIQFIERLQGAMADETDPGPGRADSFDLIRDLLWSGEHSISLSAPVSIPHLFTLNQLKFIHWDGNTNSVMQRNIAQAVALGAYFNEKTLETHVLPRQIHLLEETARKIRPPKWPGQFLGPLDPAKVARGQELFRTNCAECHADNEEGKPLPAEHLTDPTRLRNFNEMLGEESFHIALQKIANQMEASVFQAHGIAGEEAVQLQKAPDPRWRATDSYVSRTLEGVWATAPYLHNASVPTLYDLLLPEAERPARFPVGHREFDPERVGYVANPKETRWTFDSSLQGNSNRGHNYGTTLSDPERMDLIEFMKSL